MATSIVAFIRPFAGDIQGVSVYRFDGSVGRHIGDIPAITLTGWTGTLAGVSVSPSAKYIAVMSTTAANIATGGTVAIFEQVDGEYVFKQKVPMPNNTPYLAWSSDEAFMTTNNGAAPAVSAARLVDGVFTVELAGGPLPSGILKMMSKGSRVFFLTNAGLTVYNDDGTSFSVERTISSTGMQRGDISPTTEFGYFATNATGTIRKINYLTGAITTLTIPATSGAAQTRQQLDAIPLSDNWVFMRLNYVAGNTAQLQIAQAFREGDALSYGIGVPFGSASGINAQILPLNTRDNLVILSTNGWRKSLPIYRIGSTDVGNPNNTMIVNGVFPGPDYSVDPSLSLVPLDQNSFSAVTLTGPAMRLYNKGVSLLVDTVTSRGFKLMLVSDAVVFNPDHTTMTQVLTPGTEISGNGWPVGGPVVTGLAIEEFGKVARLTSNDTGSNIFGGSITASRAVLYDTISSTPLAFVDFGGPITANSGERLSLKFDETGIVTYYPE